MSWEALSPAGVLRLPRPTDLCVGTTRLVAEGSGRRGRDRHEAVRDPWPYPERSPTRSSTTSPNSKRRARRTGSSPRPKADSSAEPPGCDAYGNPRSGPPASIRTWARILFVAPRWHCRSLRANTPRCSPTASATPPYEPCSTSTATSTKVQTRPQPTDSTNKSSLGLMQTDPSTPSGVLASEAIGTPSSPRERYRIPICGTGAAAVEDGLPELAP